MGARTTLVLLVVTVVAGCGSTAGVRGPAPFPLATRPGSPGDVPITASPGLAPASGAGIALLDTALSLRGIAYRLGGQEPATGFDCSGLVRYVFALHAVDLPRTVTEQFAAGQSVEPDEIRAGDLLFFSTTAPGSGAPSHVGIALGPRAQGEFVHAPGTGSVVRVERFDTPYWRTRWVGAKRTSGVFLRKT